MIVCLGSEVDDAITQARLPYNYGIRHDVHPLSIRSVMRIRIICMWDAHPKAVFVANKLIGITDQVSRDAGLACGSLRTLCAGIAIRASLPNGPGYASNTLNALLSRVALYALNSLGTNGAGNPPESLIAGITFWTGGAAYTLWSLIPCSALNASEASWSW